jgi:hypothetical protein
MRRMRIPRAALLALVPCVAGALHAQDTNTPNRKLLGSDRSTEIHVDEKCHISEIAPHSDGLKQHVYTDRGICSVSGNAVSQREETDINDNKRIHRIVTIQEHTFALHNPNEDQVTFYVDQKVPKGWQIDSDPPPASVNGSVATFIVVVAPGETANLHVGERNPPVLNTEPR